MSIQIPKLSLDHLKAEADRIAAQKKSSGKGDLPPLRYFNFELGLTRLRVLPPSMKGEIDGIALMLYRHWDMPGDKEKEICISSTYPDCGASCPIDPVLDKYKAMDVDVWRWNASGKALANILVRGQEEKTAQLCELPMSVYNWIIGSIVDENMLGTFFDPKRGVDIHVVKKVTKEKGKKEKTTYDSSWSPKGPTPIATDVKKLRDILESCYELTDIYKPFDPKSEYGRKLLMRLKATASALDRRLADKEGTDPDEVEDQEEEPSRKAAKKTTKGSAITKSSSDNPECFGHSHADKTVEYEDVKGGYDPEEIRCVMCPVSPSCSNIVLKKYPEAYNNEGTEIVSASSIKKAPASAKKAAKKSSAKKAVKQGRR